MISPRAKAIRRIIGHIDGAWVRVWKDGTTWAGSNRKTARAAEEVRLTLEAAGYPCSMDGKPATEGEHIVTVGRPWGLKE